MKPLLTIGLLLIMATCYSQDRDPGEGTPSACVIIYIDKTEINLPLDQALHSLQNNLEFPEGYPKTMKSGEIENWDAGQVLWVLGLCNDQYLAEIQRQYMSYLLETDVRTAEIPSANKQMACAALDTVGLQTGEMEVEYLDILYAGCPSLSWSVYHKPIAEGVYCMVYEHYLAVELDGMILAFEKFEDFCENAHPIPGEYLQVVGPDDFEEEYVEDFPEPDMAEPGTTGWSFEPVVLGEHVFVLVETVDRYDGYEFRSADLYGFEGDGLRPLAGIFTSGDPYDDYYIQPDADTWSKFSVVIIGEEGAVQTRYEWDREYDGFVEKGTSDIEDE